MDCVCMCQQQSYFAELPDCSPNICACVVAAEEEMLYTTKYISVKRVTSQYIGLIFQFVHFLLHCLSFSELSWQGRVKLAHSYGRDNHVFFGC